MVFVLHLTRGYTAWDVTSPAFIMTVGNGKTLCVPTIFISYTGETLDFKAPLLKSIQALDVAATEVAHYFDRDVKHVQNYLGLGTRVFFSGFCYVLRSPGFSNDR
ncbi:MAG: glutamine synthetase III [Chitinophagales bacterium]